MGFDAHTRLGLGSAGFGTGVVHLFLTHTLVHGLEGSGAYTAKMFMCADVASDFKEDSAVLGGRLRGFIWSRDSDPHKVSVTQVWGLWAIVGLAGL